MMSFKKKEFIIKGIILAGGNGSRLYPCTKAMSKQLLPIYDKPLVYYPLSVLMLAGIHEILIITSINDKRNYQNLLGDGSNLGISIKYIEQFSPDGIAQSFILGKEFIGDDDVCLILGDNIFYGHGLIDYLKLAIQNLTQTKKATIFGYYVNDPERYGVINFNKNHEAISLEEKPKIPKSNYAVTGLYFYPNNVVQKANKVKPSNRGELEITTINEMFLVEGFLNIEILKRGITWLDAGTPSSFLKASLFIEAIENRQGLKVACLEEIAFKKGFIQESQILNIVKSLAKCDYSRYLLKIIKNNN